MVAIVCKSHEKEQRWLESNQDGLTQDDGIWREIQYATKLFQFYHKLKTGYECLDTRRGDDSRVSMEGKAHLLSRFERVFSKSKSLGLEVKIITPGTMLGNLHTSCFTKCHCHKFELLKSKMSLKVFAIRWRGQILV